MNKLMSRRLLTSFRAVLTATPHTPLQPSFRSFHAGGPPHTHLEEDDGKESHDDFKTKAKKAPLDESQLTAQLTELVTSNDIVLFMKGNKKMPRCGFSNYSVQVLKFYGVANYKDVDVLADDAIREGVKKFSNWPTIPQLYVKGEFIGGCDIVTEMYQTGELQTLLSDKGVSHDAAA